MPPIDSHQHPLAGITFPTAIGGFVGGEVNQYDEWGHNLSPSYRWPAGAPDTKLAFYVYPAGEATDADEMQQAVLDIYQANAGAKALGHARTLVNGLEGASCGPSRVGGRG